MILLIISSCNDDDQKVHYYQLTDSVWPRFKILTFYIPVKSCTNPVDVVFFGWFETGFPLETFDFSMIMNTPSGEERINQYQIRVKNKLGEMILPCQRDSCFGECLLQPSMLFSREGILKIELENITPRLETKGIRGIGIRINSFAE